MNVQVKPQSSVELTKKDFVSDQTIRWCPGCGDYAILASIQKLMPELGIPKEDIVFVSGIGCSSRFPYYMDTYGLHTLHGRAPAFATGLKVARPDLTVWLITGDGDGLSIGGNQLMHMLRRNLDVNVLLFNNRIYGLTKGQYSPTSEHGKVTKSTPFGSPDMPLNPMLFALSAGATFVARTYDVDPKGMKEIFKEAAEHKGTSFVEIFQNCNIFNDGTFSPIYERPVRDDQILNLKHGEPFIFGKNKNKGIRLNGLKPEIVEIENVIKKDDLLRHDQYSSESTLANVLSNFNYPEFPVPMGILRQINKSTYGDIIENQINSQLEKLGEGELTDVLRGAHVWTH
jgi:2-oxoglutarate ferredoxin oxidoreductase subunit beta